MGRGWGLCFLPSFFSESALGWGTWSECLLGMATLALDLMDNCSRADDIASHDAQLI